MKLLSVAFVTIFMIQSALNGQNVGIGTSVPKARFSVGSNSQFQVDGLGDIRRINDIPYFFPVIQGTNGQVLMNDGTGQLNWTSIIQAPLFIPDTIIKITPQNFLTVTVAPENYVKINGEITLTGNYEKLNENKLTVLGGSIVGNGNTVLSLGRQVVVNGTTFTNVQIDGTANSNIQFIGCIFSNVSMLPTGCSLTGCQIINSTFNVSNRIGFMNNCNISASTILRLFRISNSAISNSTMGSSTYPINLLSNNTISTCSIYLSGAFTGNDCDETRVYINGTLQPVVIASNNFVASSISNFIEIDLNSSSAFALNISTNNFRGNTTYPNSSHIHLFGNYTGTRCLVKVNNNTVIGGAGPFVSYETTGQADLIVNDNDLRAASLGVSQGGYIDIRNNLIH